MHAGPVGLIRLIWGLGGALFGLFLQRRGPNTLCTGIRRKS
jgi:hypothetical protein